MYTLFKQLSDEMQNKYGREYHLDTQDFRTREIIKVLCKLLDKKLKILEEE